MKINTKAVAALGVGYLLGRQRKLRAATVTAAAMAVGGKSGLVRKGSLLLIKSSVLGRMPQAVKLLRRIG
jgi:hypothetical protein